MNLNKAKKNKRNENIQGLRGILALMVFLGHVLCAFKIPFILNNLHTPIHLFYDGQAAVVCFFVLSGYFYFSNNLDLKQLFIKIINKVIRIFPPYLISLVVGALFINTYLKFNYHASTNTTEWIQSFWNTDISLTEFLKQASIIFRSDCNKINPPSWYLNGEFKMMFLFPILYIIFRYTNKSIAFILIVLSVVINNPLPLLISCFLVGYILHAYENSIRIQNPLLIVIIGFLLLNVRNCFPLSDFYIVNNIYQLLQCVGAAMIIYSLKNTKRNFILNKFFVFLGNISYEFFIIHFIVLMALLPFISTWYYCLLFTFIISLIWAYITNKFFTKYSIRIK